MTAKEYNACVDGVADGIYRFIMKHIRNDAEARDVVQNSFEILWRNHGKINAEKAKSYLYTVAYRNMIDGIRKQKKIQLTENEEDMAVSFDKGRSDTIGFTGGKDAINMALEKLTEVQRSILMLRDYEGYSYHEIGEILNLSESQVKVYLFRARVSVRKFLVSPQNVI